MTLNWMCQTHNTKALNPSSFPSDHIFPFGRLLNQHQLQGRRREVSTGGGADSDWGGQIQVSQTTYPQILISPRISPSLFWKYWKI